MASWAQVEVVSPRRLGEALSDVLLDHGAAGVQEDFLPGTAPPPRQPWDTGPVPPAPDPVLLRSWHDAQGFEEQWPALQAALLAAGGRQPTWAPVKDEDWASSWRSAFQRVVVSAGVAVAPPWLAEPGDLVIDPGMAFGTGEHPSTRACLAATERLGRAGERCLDVGHGSGVVALLAARMGMQARGIDIDQEAVDAGYDNAERNGVQAAFDLTPLQQVQGRFHLVVANIFAEVLVTLAPDLARVCGGHLVLAGILSDRAHLVRDAMQAQGLRLVEGHDDGEWTWLVYQSPEPLPRVAA